MDTKSAKNSKFTEVVAQWEKKALAKRRQEGKREKREARKKRYVEGVILGCTSI